MKNAWRNARRNEKKNALHLFLLLLLSKFVFLGVDCAVIGKPSFEGNHI
jgi:hypothetical protein